MYGLNMSYFQVIWTAVLLCLRSTVLCTPLLTGDFDSQLRHILHNQMLSAQEAADMVSQALDDVRATLNQRWQGFNLTPYGSSTIGLCAKTSDLDFSLQLQHFNCSASSYVAQEAKTLFMEQPALYSSVRVVDAPKHIHVSLFHNPSQRDVDVMFSGEGAVYNSMLVKYYFNLVKRFQPLGAFLKFWFKIHGLTGHGQGTLTLPNYALYLLIIFYLQQKNMAPPGYVLQVDAQSHITSDSPSWDVGFNELPYRSENTDSLHQLLGGFFKYYSEFDFENYIVSPFTGHPIPRNAFSDIDNFPKEYTLNNNTLTHTKLKLRNDLNISTDVCIQDVFVHDSNVAERVSHELATKFKYLMKSAATMFADLPSDDVLRAILVMDQHKGTVSSYNNCTVNVINKYDCIKVTDT